MSNNKDKGAPNWQPIEQLTMISQHITAWLADNQEQYRNLLQARSKPHVLDDYTVNRVKEVYSTQKDDLWLFDEQLQRWQALPNLTPYQKGEVERLVGQMAKLREVIDQILALAGELSKGTIEKVLAKSDLELGLEALLGQSERGTNTKSGKSADGKSN